MTNDYPNINDPEEQQFREAIQSWEAAPAEAWDTPPDKLWSNIAPAAKPSLRHFWWPLAGLVIMVAAGLFTRGYTDNPMAAATKQDSASQLPTITRPKVPESSATGSSTSAAESTVPVNYANPMTKRSHSSVSMVPMPAIPHDKALETAVAEQALPIASLPVSALAPLSPLALTMATPELIPPLPIVPAKPSFRFFAGAFITPSHTFRQVRAQSPRIALPAFLRENESAAWTTEYGLRFGWQPNRRWAFSSGLTRYQVRQEANHRIRVSFDPGRERPLTNNTGFEGAYLMTVPSAYGSTGVEVRLLRAPGFNAPPAGQQLLLNIHTDHTLTYLSVPLSAHYFMGSARFSVGVKAGVALNFLQTNHLLVNASSIQRGFSSRSATITQRLTTHRQFDLDYQLGTALWYRPHPGWVISAEPTFRHSLRPLISVDNFSVRQYAWGIQLGVQKNF